MNNPISSRLSNFATSIEWQPSTGLYVYKLELSQAESSEISRLAHYGYDCDVSTSCHDITWPAEGIVAYHFHEHEAHEVVEAYDITDSALATCGMESLHRKLSEFVGCVV